MKKFKDKKLSKKVLACVLSAVLVVGMMPVSNTFATNKNTSKTTQEQVTNEDNETDSASNDNSKKETDTSKNSSDKTEDTKQNSTESEKTKNSTSDTSSKKSESKDTSKSSTDTSKAKTESSEKSSSKDETEKQTTEKSDELWDVTTSQLRSAASLAVNYTEDPYSGTCRLAGTTQYYASLDTAIEDLKDTGGTIEIYKDTSLSQSHTITQNFTIKNITNPGTLDPVNPKKNGSTHEQPQVSIADGGQLLIDGGTISFEGVYVDGHNVSRSTSVKVSAGTVATEHNPTSAIVVKSGMVTVMDGAAGTDSAGLEATATVFCNFNNSGEGGGVFCVVGGDVMVDSGTFTQNTSSSDGGVFGMLEGGMVSVTGGTFSNNTAAYGGVICANAANASNAATLNIAGATFKGNSTTSGGGGFAFLGIGATMILTAGTITENSASNGFGSAIDVHSGTLDVSGNPSIEKNAAADNGAVYVDSTNGKVTLTDSPRIVNNNGHNLTVGAASQVVVQSAGLTEDARIGISNLVAEGTQFATTDSSKTAANTAYLACFSNDTNPTLIPDTTATATTTAIKWRKANDGTNDYVCYITDANGITTYYTSLNAAIDGRNALSDADATIEIFKSHNFSAGGATAAEKTLAKATTIKNVDSPLNTAVDWSKNGNATAPVVTFEAATCFGIGADNEIIFEGVKFDGQSINRTLAGFYIAAGAVVTIKDGENVDLNANILRTLKTETVISNFVNTTTTETGSAGLFNLLGKVILSSGTIAGCKAATADFTGGGSVALIRGGGEFQMDGGTVTDNGRSDSGLSSGSFNMLPGSKFTMTAGTISNNRGNHGGVFTMRGDGITATISGGKISENYASQRGGVFYVSGPGSGGAGAQTLTIEGDTEISGNTSANSSSAIEIREGSTVNIKDTVKIINNTCNATGNSIGAVATYNDSNVAGTINIYGSPTIYGNKDGAGNIRDIVPNSNTNVKVYDLGKGAKMGYYSSNSNYIDVTKQFSVAASGNALTTQNVSGSFINNKTAGLVSIPGTGNAIVWGYAVVKETTGSTGTGDFVKYYDSLNNALTNVTSGNTLEILKTHTLTGNATLAAGKTCYIRNVVNPANDTENPFKTTDASGRLVYEASNEPIVYFAKSGTAYRLTISGTCKVEGVKFSGLSWTGVSGVAPVANNRGSSGFLISAGASLSIDNGQAGTLPDSTADNPNVRTACETTMSDFVNSSSALATAGGLFYLSGSVELKAGTISGCKTSSTTAGWYSGGAVAYIPAGGTFSMTGGTVSGNGVYQRGTWAECAFNIYGGTFTMTDGIIENNYGDYGGVFNINNTVTGSATITGGIIRNNKAYDQGGVVFMSETLTGSANTGKKCTIGGTVQIYGNSSNQGGVAYVRSSSAISIGGNAHITNNTGDGCIRVDAGWTGNTPTISVSDSPVIYNNLNGTAQSNIYIGSVAHLLVTGALGKSAKMGVYPTTAAMYASGGTFATASGGDATNCGYLASFYNDRTNGTNGPLRGADNLNQYVKWTDLVPTVKLTETIKVVTTNADGTTATTYKDNVHLFGGTTAISDALTCANDLPIANIVTSDNENRPYQGYFPIELLKATDDTSYKLGTQVTVNVDTARKVLLTTAMTQAQQTATGMTYDGYAGPGTDNPATIYRAVANVALFNLSSGDLTVKNLIVDGQKATYTCNNSTGLFYLAGANSKLTLSDGSVLQNSKTVGEAGAVRVEPSSTLIMEGTSEDSRAVIKNCVGQGGAIAAWRATIEMKGYAKIESCEATYSTYTKAGAIIAWSCNFSMTDNAEISGCTAALHSAISLGLSTGDAKRTTKISGNAKIQNNTCTGTASATYQTVAVGKVGGHDVTVEVSGSPYIYNNTAPGVEQANLGDLSNENTGADIKVGEAGLSNEATVGVTSKNNAESGDTFARTESASAATSTNASNLEKFINDKDTSLKGIAGDDDRVIWSKLIPVNLIINVAEKATDDMWFTLQMQSETTGKRSRFSVCIKKGSKTGSTVVMENSGIKNSFALIAGGSPNGYTLSTPTLSNTPTAASGQTIGENEALESSTTFSCYLTLSTACSKQGEIDSTSGIRELSFNASWKSPTDVTKLSSQSGVTNTID